MWSKSMQWKWWVFTCEAVYTMTRKKTQILGIAGWFKHHSLLYFIPSSKVWKCWKRNNWEIDAWMNFQLLYVDPIAVSYKSFACLFWRSKVTWGDSGHFILLRHCVKSSMLRRLQHPAARLQRLYSFVLSSFSQIDGCFTQEALHIFGNQLYCLSSIQLCCRGPCSSCSFSF